jgi:hypothetical protein
MKILPIHPGSAHFLLSPGPAHAPRAPSLPLPLPRAASWGPRDSDPRCSPAQTEPRHPRAPRSGCHPPVGAMPHGHTAPRGPPPLDTPPSIASPPHPFKRAPPPDAARFSFPRAPVPAPPTPSHRHRSRTSCPHHRHVARHHRLPPTPSPHQSSSERHHRPPLSGERPLRALPSPN